MECLGGNMREAHRRRMVLDLDLNLLPPNENSSLDGISTSASPQAMQAEEHQPQVTMDVEDIDDEVAIISPRIFVEARNKSRRNQKWTNVHSEDGHSEWSLSVPPSEEPTFACPLCMGKLIEETSTKCGHIFCKKCIQAEIAAQKNCPTCRQRITMRDIFRIYLPATN